MGVVVAAVELALAAVFAVAAVGKLRDRTGFLGELVAVRGPWRLVRSLSVLLPVLELAAAAALVLTPWVGVSAPEPVFRRWMGGAGALTLLLLGTFTGHLLLARQLDAAGGCRCFGARRTSRARAITRNLGLIVAVLWVAWFLTSWLPAATLIVTAAGVLGAVLTRRPPPAPTPLDDDPHRRADPALPPGPADPTGQRMLVFTEADCAACAHLLPEVRSWQADPRPAGAAHPEVLLVDDPAELDRFGVTRTPSALVLDAAGLPVDGNGRPAPVARSLAVGPEGVRARYLLARRGHDLPLPEGAERTLLVFLDRAAAGALDPATIPPPSATQGVVVLSPHRVRARGLPRVQLDPHDRVARLYGVTTRPAAVTVDRAGRPLGPVRTGPGADLATLLQPPRS